MVAFSYGWKRLAFDRLSIAFFLAAAALCYLNFYGIYSPYFQPVTSNFALDPGEHEAYIHYILEHGSIPSRFITGAAHHPPGYYLLASGLYKIFDVLGAEHPMHAVRHLSMVFYFTFLTFAALLLRTVLITSSTAYYAALCLVLFWPIGITMGARITPDIPLYAAETAVLYYGVTWLKKKELAALSNILFAAGCALLVKNSGMLWVIIASVIGCMAIARSYAAHGRTVIKHSMPGMVFVLLCVAVTAYHGTWEHYAAQAIAGTQQWSQVLRSFTVFDLPLYVHSTIINPHTVESQALFWNIFLRSLILGTMIDWKALAVVFTLGIWELALIAYIAFGILKFFRFFRADAAICVMLLVPSAAMIGMMMLASVHSPNFYYYDARYAYPIVVVIAAFFGKIIVAAQKNGNAFTVQTGRGLATGLVLLSISLFISQYILLAHIQ